MGDQEITLVGAAAFTKDADGNEIPTPQQRQIIGDVKSATSAEFSNAGKLGLKPSCMVEVWSEEYSGETEIIVDGEILTIYRTFEKDDRMELHCAEKTGNVS